MRDRRAVARYAGLLNSAQHLRYRPRVDPKTLRRFPPAHPFDLNRKRT
jgi:hypothetical protein